MTEYTITREDAERDLRALRGALSGIPVGVSSSIVPALNELIDSIEEQVKPALDEPTGDCVVFFSIRHPRQGIAWAADDGNWEDGTGFSLSWEQLVGDAKPEDILLYRRAEYPEVLRIGVGEAAPSADADEFMVSAGFSPKPLTEPTPLVCNCYYAAGHHPNCDIRLPAELRSGPRFCEKTRDCRMAAGHDGGCQP